MFDVKMCSSHFDYLPGEFKSDISNGIEPKKNQTFSEDIKCQFIVKQEF